MTGSIHKKGKTYYIVFRFHDSNNGKRSQKWIPAGKSKKEADKKLTEMIGEVHNGTYREIKKIIFADFAKLWLSSYAELKLKPSTLRSYNDIISNHLIPVMGDYQVSECYASIQTTLDRYGHLIREVNTEQVRRLENMLGYLENPDSFSDSKNKSVRSLLEEFGKNDSECFVQPLPNKALQVVANA